MILCTPESNNFVDDVPRRKIRKSEMDCIFLAGSIENGKAENWQEKAVDYLYHYRCIVCNPRRDDWNPNATEKDIAKQIRWEQECLSVSEIILFYFDPNTISPITLLELGMAIGQNKEIVVVCTPEYFRYTNVVTTLKFHGYDEPLSTLEEGLKKVCELLQS